MPELRMQRHYTGKVTCSQGDFSEVTDLARDVQAILSDAAMHAISRGKGHVISEHIEDDRTIEAEWTGEQEAV
jgi:hypothetical protein